MGRVLGLLSGMLIPAVWVGRISAQNCWVYACAPSVEFDGNQATAAWEVGGTGEGRGSSAEDRAQGCACPRSVAHTLSNLPALAGILPQEQCSQESRRRWWLSPRSESPPCTSRSRPACNGLRHPGECCPVSNLCKTGQNHSVSLPSPSRAQWWHSGAPATERHICEPQQH